MGAGVWGCEGVCSAGAGGFVGKPGGGVRWELRETRVDGLWSGVAASVNSLRSPMGVPVGEPAGADASDKGWTNITMGGSGVVVTGPSLPRLRGWKGKKTCSISVGAAL